MGHLSCCLKQLLNQLIRVLVPRVLCCCGYSSVGGYLVKISETVNRPGNSCMYRTVVTYSMDLIIVMLMWSFSIIWSILNPGIDNRPDSCFSSTTNVHKFRLQIYLSPCLSTSLISRPVQPMLPYQNHTVFRCPRCTTLPMNCS
jgi:hypothetical protein